ncbi:KCTD1_15 [Mytilus coruscus]|uniref:KCTD1_15 n=1 Tax=Mytilus coruscus TaxID=42192 RepID=A0A6J8BYZ9_MYTCO|nr:KCTD1_15 [Mytilus coruscus]
MISIVFIYQMSHNLENKGEKRPRLSDGENPKPEGKLYKMSSNDDNIKDQLKIILESMNDTKKGLSSTQKMFEIEGVVAEGSISGAMNVNQTNQSNQNNQVNQQNNDEVTVMASDVPLEEDEDFLIKAKQGYAKVDHYPDISEEDLQKLYSDDTPFFDVNTPYGLQFKVWFELMLFLCRRGQENLRTMTKDTFRTKKDASGLKYVYQNKDELDKIHRTNTDPFDSVTEGRMYEKKGDLKYPAASVEKYVSKLCQDFHPLMSVNLHGIANLYLVKTL